MYAAGCPLQSMVLVLSHALSEGLGRAGNQNFPYFMLELVILNLEHGLVD